jgi:hypothetical protein
MELGECAENARQPDETVRRALPCGHKVGGYTARPSVYVHPGSLIFILHRRRLYRPTNRVPSRALVKQRRLGPALSQHWSARSATKKYHMANRKPHCFDICDHNWDRDATGIPATRSWSGVARRPTRDQRGVWRAVLGKILACSDRLPLPRLTIVGCASNGRAQRNRPWRETMIEPVSNQSTQLQPALDPLMPDEQARSDAAQSAACTIPRGPSA